MKTKILATIENQYGNRATASPLDRELYSRDLAPVPPQLIKPLFETRPELVVRPLDALEIADLVKKARIGNIPITPRASGSTVFFNTVPLKGGIVLDLGLLNGVSMLNEEALTVTVKAATTWTDLEEYLNKHGFACKSMPSSAPSASIGGWFNMMGYGIGSLKYGSMLSQVKAIEVVSPDGTIQTISNRSNPPLEWYAASEGTLGIVTSIELEIRMLQPMKHYLLQVPDIEIGQEIMRNLVEFEITPFNMHFSERYFLQEMKSLGFSHVSNECGCLLAVDFEGSREELLAVEAHISSLVQSNSSLTIMPEEIAEREWEERFRSIRLKRGGPSILGGELWLPLGKLKCYLTDIEKMAKRYGLVFMSYGHLASTSHVTVMTMFYTNETSLVDYLFDLSLVKKIQDAGYRQGGSPYGVGLWNTPYINRLHDKSMQEKLIKRKQEVDPNNLMNPGKLYQPPAVLKPFVFHIGMESASIIRQLIKKGR